MHPTASTTGWPSPGCHHAHDASLHQLATNRSSRRQHSNRKSSADRPTPRNRKTRPTGNSRTCSQHPEGPAREHCCRRRVRKTEPTPRTSPNANRQTRDTTSRSSRHADRNRGSPPTEQQTRSPNHESSDPRASEPPGQPPPQDPTGFRTSQHSATTHPASSTTENNSNDSPSPNRRPPDPHAPRQALRTCTGTSTRPAPGPTPAARPPRVSGLAVAVGRTDHATRLAHHPSMDDARPGRQNPAGSSPAQPRPPSIAFQKPRPDDVSALATARTSPPRPPVMRNPGTTRTCCAPCDPPGSQTATAPSHAPNQPARPDPSSTASAVRLPDETIPG